MSDDAEAMRRAAREVWRHLSLAHGSAVESELLGVCKGLEPEAVDAWRQLIAALALSADKLEIFAKLSGLMSRQPHGERLPVAVSAQVDAAPLDDGAGS